MTLVVLVFRRAILFEERLRDVEVDESLLRMRRFVRATGAASWCRRVSWRLVFAVFDRIPDVVIAPRVPDHAQSVYWAAVLAVKNPTIIALTMIWQVGVIRQMLLHDYSPDSGTAPAEA